MPKIGFQDRHFRPLSHLSIDCCGSDSPVTRFAIMDDRTFREMRAIDVIHAHFWIVIGYTAFSLACLLWLEFRAAPRWSVWVTFIVLALPVLAYSSACLHIGNKFILWTAAGDEFNCYPANTAANFLYSDFSLSR